MTNIYTPKAHPRGEVPEPKDPPFGKRHASRASWDNWADRAEAERFVMVAEFKIWAIKTKLQTEEELIRAQVAMRAGEPFARAGIDKAETPQDVPLCVIEFAMNTLNMLERQRKLDLCNLYFEAQASMGDEYSIQAERSEEAEIKALWDLFIEEREEEQGKPRKKPEAA